MEHTTLEMRWRDRGEVGTLMLARLCSTNTVPFLAATLIYWKRQEN